MNIRKVEGKTGTSYKITVTHGRDMNGKQIRHYLTWTPPAKMTQRQIDKELNAVAVEFERKILDGFAVDSRQTFAAYADYVISLKERDGTKHRTIELYRSQLNRVNKAIGHLKLVDIRPAHLNTFYTNIGESGIREGGDRATSKVDFAAMLKEKKLSRAQLSKLAKVSPTTITYITRGERVKKDIAAKVAAALGSEVESLFTIDVNSNPLNAITILGYHRLISTVLKQAEKEMIVQYNAAARATPPKKSQHEAETFQPEDVTAIRDALEAEPLKWRTFTHLLLVTGCRRGEIAGLKWDKVDWENSQIKVDAASLYSQKKGVYEDTTKTSTTRFVKLPAETMQLLREYRAWYAELQIKNGDRWQKSGNVFVQDNGKPMHPDSITDWLAKFSDRHGLPHVNPHKFRHTHASLLYFGGMDSISISKRLGHAKVSTTTDIY